MGRVDKLLFAAKYGKDPVAYFRGQPDVESVTTIDDEIIVKYRQNPKRIFCDVEYGRCNPDDRGSTKVFKRA